MSTSTSVQSHSDTCAYLPAPVSIPSQSPSPSPATQHAVVIPTLITTLPTPASPTALPAAGSQVPQISQVSHAPLTLRDAAASGPYSCPVSAGTTPADSSEAIEPPQISLTLLLVSGHRRNLSFDLQSTVMSVKEKIWSTWPVEWKDEQPPSAGFLRLLYLGKIWSDEARLVGMCIFLLSLAGSVTPVYCISISRKLISLSLSPFDQIWIFQDRRALLRLSSMCQFARFCHPQMMTWRDRNRRVQSIAQDEYLLPRRALQVEVMKTAMTQMLRVGAMVLRAVVDV